MYRLYRLDQAGKIASADWLEAPNDDEARRQAAQLGARDGYEVWQRDRLVERVNCDS
jgi:hypothetical protein